MNSSNMPESILIVEDEQDVVDLLSFTLKKEGYRVFSSSNGDDAIRKAQQNHPSLILLDLMLPGIPGMDVCRSLKRDPRLSSIPIIMLTAKTEETDRIVGFEVGADDYITKPFSPREVALRVKAILRRLKHHELKTEGILKAGNLLIDNERHLVTFKGKTIGLTSTEFKLLSLLVERRGRVQTRDKLLEDVWNYEASIDTRTVDTHIRRLREKVGTQVSDMIETIRGVGYRFRDVAKD